MYIVVQDDVDGHLKFKFHIGKKSKRKTASTSSETTPASPNNAYHGENVNSSSSGAGTDNVITPNVREEAQLIDTDPLGGLKQASTSSLELEPGDDPLTSLGEEGGGGEVGGVTQTKLVEKSDSRQDVNNYRHGDHHGGAGYGECLSNEDHANVRGFMYELVGRRLLPHLNEALKSLNEWVRSINVQCMTKN